MFALFGPVCACLWVPYVCVCACVRVLAGGYGVQKNGSNSVGLVSTGVSTSTCKLVFFCLRLFCKGSPLHCQILRVPQ